MSSSSSISNNQPLFSESFLNYLNVGTNLNKPTFCEEKSNKYHDSSYIWCRICDKIFCTQCSMNHLIANQITHNPSEKVFLRKEHFDVEFKRDFEKLQELKNKINNFFAKKNSELTINKITLLRESLNKITSLTNEICTIIIPNFIRKYTDLINALCKSMKEQKVITPDEKKFKQQYNFINEKFSNIEKKYTKNEKFEPRMLKPYFDDLSNSYREFQNFNELLNSNLKVNNVNANDSNKEYEKINSDITKVINILISFKKDLNH